MAGCNSYLSRFTWRHDSVLNFIASILQSVHFNNLYVDLPGFHNPSIITGDEYRPDLLLKTKDDCLYILELTVGYETNLRNNIERKQENTEMLLQNKRDTLKQLNLLISLSVHSEFLTKNLQLSLKCSMALILVKINLNIV